MDISIVFFVLLMASFAFLAFKVYQRADTLSMTSGTLAYAKWARSNKTEARWILLVFNIAMMTCGLCIGLVCYRAGLRLGEPMIYVGLGLFLLGTILFPTKEKSDPKIATRYRKKRWLSILKIAGSTLALMAYTTNYLITESTVTVNEASIDSVILVIFATVGLLLFGYGILALSCGLACAGHEGIAILVLFGGISGVIILYIWALRRIFKRKKKTKQANSEFDELVDDNII